MARCSLLFEDVEGGEVAFRCDLHGGFNKDSHAQALAARVIQFLEDEKISKVMTLHEPKPEKTEIIEPRRIIY